MAQWEKFGPEIKILRGDKSIQEIAGLAGIDRGHLSRLENSKSRPTEETVYAIARALNADPDRLAALAGYLPTQIINLIPILGTIRAGLPILAEENYDGYLDVPESIKADYVLRVTGDSMIGAGILDGDYAICRESESPQTGQIIVAARDEGSTREATLKYYFNGNGQPHLKAANPTFTDLNYNDGYKCIGVMVALIREDSPGYQVYKDYLAVNDSEEWTEVIEMAAEAGLKVNQVKEILAGQIDIAKKLRG